MRSARLWTAGASAVLCWGEWLNRRWSRMLVTRADTAAGAEAVVVLGYRNRRARINVVNRWRVRIGLRSVAGDHPGTIVIFSGGPTHGAPPEARLMADHARSTHGFAGRVIIEDQSRSTWENVANVIPLIEDVERVKIASQPGHALKARAYLRRQRPDLAERLVPARDYRMGEWLPLKPVLAVYGLWTLRGLTPDERSSRRDPSGADRG